MYDQLHGELLERQAARVVVGCAGVGYELRVPAGTLADAPIGSQVRLHTILHVTDGVPMLLGFATRSERDLGRRLLGVTGVGPALAISVLTAFRPGELAEVVAHGDHAALKRIKGVGAKTAERLCLELRDQIHKVELEPAARSVLAPRPAEDAVAALVVLGYGEKEAREKVQGARAKLPDAATEELVKIVLRGA
jgi:Holliday junction DNA helicase RuvA